jgi:[ribosomal protein S5]-alanine N-acetyltransferase
MTDVERTAAAAGGATGTGARVDGARTHLRELEVDDVGEAYCRWLNDPEVNRYLESRYVVHTVHALREWVAAKRADPDNVLFGIMLNDGNVHIGNIKLGPVDRTYGTADIGLFIGEKAHWGRGYATEAIDLIARYAFDTLRLRKVTASCYSSNESSARAFEKVGFEREGLRRAQFLSEHGPEDQIMLGLLRPDLKN